MVGFDYAPQGWALCNGQTLPIPQNQALFSPLGTHYGGNGRTTFALPDLRGRVPVHQGQGHGRNYSMGQLEAAVEPYLKEAREAAERHAEKMETEATLP